MQTMLGNLIKIEDVPFGKVIDRPPEDQMGAALRCFWPASQIRKDYGERQSKVV